MLLDSLEKVKFGFRGHGYDHSNVVHHAPDLI